MKTRAEIEAWLDEQLAGGTGPRCRRCQGVGFTRWAAFVWGLASLLAGPEAIDMPRACGRCRGTGRQP